MINVIAVYTLGGLEYAVTVKGEPVFCYTTHAEACAVAADWINTLWSFS